MNVIIYTDGGARGNPGPAGIGVVIYSATRGMKNEKQGELKLIDTFGKYIGETTNNQAEYRALIAALERAKKLGATEVECFLDSELVVKQMNRDYRVRDRDLQPLFVRVWNLALEFKKISFTHVRRERNREADKLVNEAIDRARIH